MPTDKFFNYKKNELYCEGMRIRDIARKVGTPFYLYSQSSIEKNFLDLKTALHPLNPLICYAVKACSNLSVLKTLVKLGAGMDIVSGGELFRAMKAGCPPSRIVYAGVGKTRKEIKEAIRAGIFAFNAESYAELTMINEEAEKSKRKVRVALRINPDVDAKTHKKITTGKAENKFGIDIASAQKIFLTKKQFPNLLIKGIHVHIGSQITKVEPFIKALKRVLSFADRLEKKGASIETLDLGGGLGIVYHNEKPISVKDYGKKISRLLKGKSYRIIFEPGRYITGNAGVLVAGVHLIKKSSKKKFVVVDAAMNDLMRPAIYEAYHGVLPVLRKAPAGKVKADVVGPVCETGDVLAFGRKLPRFEEGDLIAIMSSGAYGFSMASQYNSRPRAAEVMVKGRNSKVIRKRESYASLVAGEE